MLAIAAVALASTVAVGGTALVGLGSLNQAARTMYADNSAQVARLASVRADLATTRIGLLNYVTQVSPDGKQTQKDKLSSAQKSFAGHLTEYRNAVGDAAASDTIAAAYARYVQSMPGLMAFGDAKDFKGYAAQRVVEAVPASVALDKAVDALTKTEQSAWRRRPLLHSAPTAPNERWSGG